MAWNLKSLERTLLIGSTLVEGSTLTEAEAASVLAGKTLMGHPIHEIRELLNYRAAVVWFMKSVEKVPYLSQDLVLGFHSRLFQGFPGEHGQWKTHRNFTFHSDGSRYDYLTPNKVARAMQKWIEAFNVAADKDFTAFVANLYYRFQEVHPFDDGNGRVGRILIAYWLHWKVRSSYTFQLKDKIAHLKALEAANDGDLALLVEFFRKRMKKEK